MNRIKVPVIGVGLIIIILVAIAAAKSYAESSKLTLEVAPLNGSTISVSGKGYRAGKSSFKPGTYMVVFSHSGFASVSQQVNLIKGASRYLGAALVPNSAATSNWYNTNPKDKKAAEGISSKNTDQIYKDQTASLPLIKDLPFIDNFFRIDYGPSLKYPKDPTKSALYVKYYSEDGKQQANDWLKFKGYNPANLEVYYKSA